MLPAQVRQDLNYPADWAEAVTLGCWLEAPEGLAKDAAAVPVCCYCCAGAPR